MASHRGVWPIWRSHKYTGGEILGDTPFLCLGLKNRCFHWGCIGCLGCEGWAGGHVMFWCSTAYSWHIVSDCHLFSSCTQLGMIKVTWICLGLRDWIVCFLNWIVISRVDLQFQLFSTSNIIIICGEGPRLFPRHLDYLLLFTQQMAQVKWESTVLDLVWGGWAPTHNLSPHS